MSICIIMMNATYLPIITYLLTYHYLPVTAYLSHRERELQMEKQRMTKQYIEDFKVAQQEWKRKEKEAMEEENRKIMEFANVQKAREEAQKLEKQAR